MYLHVLMARMYVCMYACMHAHLVNILKAILELPQRLTLGNLATRHARMPSWPIAAEHLYIHMHISYK